VTALLITAVVILAVAALVAIVAHAGQRHLPGSRHSSTPCRSA
jgi:hypothetical protein